MIPERKPYVEAVAAEIAHEILAPINYFRSLFERAARGEKLDEQELEIAGEELARLDALVSTLRRLAAHRIERAPVALSELVARLQRPAAQRLEIEIDERVSLHCDANRVAVALDALVENALLAAGTTGRAGLFWRARAQGAGICVWDSGRGFESTPAFARSSFPERAGLGWTVAQRAIREHGWKLELTRTDDRTLATILVREEDLLP